MDQGSLYSKAGQTLAEMLIVSKMATTGTRLMEGTRLRLDMASRSTAARTSARAAPLTHSPCKCWSGPGCVMHPLGSLCNVPQGSEYRGASRPYRQDGKPGSPILTGLCTTRSSGRATGAGLEPREGGPEASGGFRPTGEEERLLCLIVHDHPALEVGGPQELPASRIPAGAGRGVTGDLRGAGCNLELACVHTQTQSREVPSRSGFRGARLGLGGLAGG